MILTANFTGQPVSEVLLIGKEKTIIGRFDHLKDACTSSSNLKTTFKIVSDPSSTFLCRLFTEEATWITGDFNGDNRSEILVLPGDGSWKLFGFSGTGADQGSWQQVAESKNTGIACWDKRSFKFSVNCGKFLPGTNADVMLTAGIKNNIPDYSIYRFDQSLKQFVPCFKTTKDNWGRTTGLDTIKPDNRFFTGKFLGGPGIEVLRYNREWRYDLKQIRFGDSTFRILANVEFKGYDGDHNPKYYEMLRILPGNFIDSKKTTLMIIGRNKSKSVVRILPDVLQVYSIQHSRDE